jgi:hypothetical protein
MGIRAVNQGAEVTDRRNRPEIAASWSPRGSPQGPPRDFRQTLTITVLESTIIPACGNLAPTPPNLPAGKHE